MKDPTNAILKAYVDVLKDSIVYDGNTIYAGTAIPQRETEWVYIYIESMENIKTEGKSLFNALVALQVVSMQDILESDDMVVNDICEQVIELIDDKDAFTLNGFDLADLMPMNFDRDEQTTESNHIITRKIQVSNYIQ